MSDDYSKQLVSLISDSLPDMLWVKDLEGKYIFANKALCNGLLMAESPSEAIGKDDVFLPYAKEKNMQINHNGILLVSCVSIQM